jgi:glutathione S-transferase
VRAHVRPRIEAVWERIDAHLGASGPFLLGASPSVADFYLAMLMRWSRDMPRPATDWPRLRALADQLRARPSFAALYAAEGLEGWR